MKITEYYSFRLSNIKNLGINESKSFLKSLNQNLVIPECFDAHEFLKQGYMFYLAPLAVKQKEPIDFIELNSFIEFNNAYVINSRSRFDDLTISRDWFIFAKQVDLHTFNLTKARLKPWSEVTIQPTGWYWLLPSSYENIKIDYQY